ncbi:hypothetical protein BN9982_620018 [Mycobacterium tuberculosis]|nr:hypothetical protein BN9982_620018 [Mycobacterium tuberculosis]
MTLVLRVFPDWAHNSRLSINRARVENVHNAKALARLHGGPAAREHLHAQTANRGCAEPRSRAG